MAESLWSSAMKIRQVLDSQGSLNLWQIQAILGQSREYSLGVLSRLSCQPDVSLCREDERILLTLNRRR